jgi:stage V sporulation protein D (sporulation-specific penicillin-binding protein)
MLIIAVFVLWIGGIGARLVHLQITQHEWLSERAAALGTVRETSRQLRGTIYARDGGSLAMSVKVKTLFADATQLTDVKETAKSVAKVLKLNEVKLAKLLADGKDAGRRFVPIAKGLDSTTAELVNKELEDPKIRKSDTPKSEGLHWREDQTRTYPHGTLAAHIIGFSNAEGTGQAGIEQSQNEKLHGAVHQDGSEA